MFGIHYCVCKWAKSFNEYGRTESCLICTLSLQFSWYGMTYSDFPITLKIAWRSRFWHKHPVCPWMCYLALGTLLFLICKTCFPRILWGTAHRIKIMCSDPILEGVTPQAMITVSKQIRLAKIRAEAAQSLQAVRYLHCRELYAVHVQYKWSVTQSGKLQVVLGYKVYTCTGMLWAHSLFEPLAERATSQTNHSSEKLLRPFLQDPYSPHSSHLLHHRAQRDCLWSN